MLRKAHNVRDDHHVATLRMLTLLLIHWQGFPSRLNQLFEDLQSNVLG